jgi:hypothetical protein
MYTKPEDIDQNSLVMFDSSALLEDAEFKPETWDDVKNSWTISFRDRDFYFKRNSVKDDDQTAIDIVQEINDEQIQLDPIVRQWQAQNYALEYKRRFSIPGNTGKIKVRSELAEYVQPGQHVRTDIDAEPGGAQLRQVFRVKSIERSTTGYAQLELDAERTLPAIAYFPSVPANNPQMPTELPDIGQIRLFEAPWQNYAIGVLASRPSQIVTDFSTYYDNVTSGSFPFMGKTRSYALPGKMNAAITNTSTAAIVIDLTGTTNRELISSDPGDTAARDDTLLMFAMKIGGDGQILADSNGKAWIEVFTCRTFTITATNQVSVSIFRARKTTQARTFAANDEVWFVRRADLPVVEHADFPGIAAGAANAYFKLQPSTIYAERALSDCALRTFNFALNRDIPPEVILGTVTFGGGTSSTTDVTEGSLGVTSTGGRRRIVITGLASNQTPNAGTVIISLYRDSIKIDTIATIAGLISDSTAPFSYDSNDNPSDGAHTYYVKLRTDTAGSGARIVNATMTVT